jgi:hypothetical protein
MAEIVIRLGATQTYTTFPQIVTYINTLGNLNGDSLTVLCDKGVYPVTFGTNIVLTGGTLENHLTFKSTPEDRHLGDNGAGVVFLINTGAWGYGLTINTLFPHFEDIEFGHSGIIEGWSSGEMRLIGSSAHKAIFTRCIFSVDVVNSVLNYGYWVATYDSNTEMWFLACKIWNPLGNRTGFTNAQGVSKLVMINCSNYQADYRGIVETTNSIVINNIITGYSAMIYDVRLLEEFHHNLGHMNNVPFSKTFLYDPYDPSNLIAGGINSVGYKDVLNGDLRISRGSLAFDSAVDMSQYLTHDITYTPIVTWSMGCYHLIEIPNSTIPQPSDCSKISPLYRNAASIIMADPNNGQGMTTVPSDKLYFLGIGGANGLSYEPSMYGTICKVTDAAFYITKQYDCILNKLRGISKCTMSVLYKHTYNYGGWQQILCDYNGYFSLYVNKATQILMVTFDYPYAGLVSGAQANYSSYINIDKWCNYFVVYNGNGVSNADRLKLYVTSFGLISELPLTFTGTIPSTISNLSSYLGFGGGGGEWGNIVIYNKDLSKDDILELLTDPYKMYRDPTLMEDVMQYGWLKYIKNTASDQMAGQQVGQQKLNRYQ